MLQGRNSNNYQERAEAIVELSTGSVYVGNFVWDVDTLSWIKMTSTSSGGGGGTTVVYDVQIDEVDANTMYIGEAQVGTAVSTAGWRIKKMVVSGASTSIKYANGSTSFDKVWNNRATYTY